MSASCLNRASTVGARFACSTETTYTYDGLSLLSLDAVRSDGATHTITYVYDEAGRPWAATYSEASETVLFHLITTDRGDVVELTDEGGQAFATYRYDAWGNPVAAGTKTRGLSGSVSAELAARIAERQPLRYVGYAYDAHSALYYLSQRYYDPATFQFLTKDPARDDGEESAYQYCGGDPVGKVDPTGEAAYTLNPQEKRLKKKRWWEFPAFLSSGDAALRRAQQLFTQGLHNGKADAFRHAYWNALLTRMIGRVNAKRWTDAHEYGDRNNRPRERRMDLHNNWVGREVAARNPYASKRQVERLILNRRDLWWFGHGV